MWQILFQSEYKTSQNIVEYIKYNFDKFYIFAKCKIFKFIVKKWVFI